MDFYNEKRNNRFNRMSSAHALHSPSAEENYEDYLGGVLFALSQSVLSDSAVVNTTAGSIGTFDKGIPTEEFITELQILLDIGFNADFYADMDRRNITVVFPCGEKFELKISKL